MGGLDRERKESMRKGQKVETLTKKVGQTPRTGVVVEVRDDEFVEVEWDDGHKSIVTKSSVVPTSESNKAH
jgi:preprotein translocase subunit YajC